MTEDVYAPTEERLREASRLLVALSAISPREGKLVLMKAVQLIEAWHAGVKFSFDDFMSTIREEAGDGAAGNDLAHDAPDLRDIWSAAADCYIYVARNFVVDDDLPQEMDRANEKDLSYAIDVLRRYIAASSSR